MSVRALAELNAVRALVSDGLAQVRATSGDPEQFWIRSACLRLTAVDAVLVEAAGVVPAPVRVAAGTVVSFGAAALIGLLTRAAGLGVTGVLVAAGAALVAGLVLGPVAGRRVRVALGRRRLARAGVAPTTAPAPVVPGDIALIVVPESLERARVRLVSATLRQAGTGNWRVPELRLAARSDPAVRRLAHADLLLCQAIDCLERYLDDLAKGWP